MDDRITRSRNMFATALMGAIISLLLAVLVSNFDIVIIIGTMLGLLVISAILTTIEYIFEEQR